jgi:hypothetical protein
MENVPEAVGPESHPVVPAVRAPGTGRERVAAALQAAFAKGRLTMPELEERLAAARPPRPTPNLQRSCAT